MEIKKIAGDSFQTEVTEAGVPVLLDFYADWCGPCKAQLPVLEQAAEEACDVKFCKVNVDEEPRLAEQFQVMQVPTMLIMNGEQIFRRSQDFIRWKRSWNSWRCKRMEKEAADKPRLFFLWERKEYLCSFKSF